MTARSALVTGATGFIASHLVPALDDDGWRVRAIGRRFRPEALPDAVEYCAADFGDVRADLAPLLKGVTHVFHLAGASSSRSGEEEMQRSNVVATERLLDAVLSSGNVERMLYMSSTSVYGEEEQLPLPVREDVEPRPSRGYGKAKWGAEEAVWRAGEKGLPVIVVRPVSVHGPGAIKLLASAILDAAVEWSLGRERLVVHRNPVEQRLLHVDDLVGACLHLIDRDDAVGRAFNVTSGSYPTSHDLAGILAERFGMNVELDDDPDAGPSEEERRNGWTSMLERGMRDDIILTKERFRLFRKANINNRLSLDALRSTGFEPRHADIREAVLADVDWYRDRRWILAP